MARSARRVAPSDVATFKEAFDQGLPNVQVAESTGWVRSTVRDWRKKLGYPTSPRSKWRFQEDSPITDSFVMSGDPIYMTPTIKKAIILRRHGVEWAVIASRLGVEKRRLRELIREAYRGEGMHIPASACMLPAAAYQGVTDRVKTLLEAYGRCVSLGEVRNPELEKQLGMGNDE